MSRIRSVVAGLALAAAGLCAAPAGAQDADTPLDKSLQKLEALLGALKTQPNASQDLIKQLEEIAAGLREEKKAKEAGAGGAGTPGGGARGAGGAAGGGQMENMFLQGALRDVDLDADERAVAERLIREYGVDWRLADNVRDRGSQRVQRQDLDDRLERSLPKKKAQKIQTNIDNMQRWGRGR